MTIRFTNQRNLLDEELTANTKFVVVGAGAIGSAVVVALSKMGARDITVYDFDTLEDHNFASQMYPISGLGKSKVEALKQVASQYGDCNITAINGPFDPDTAPDCEIFISAVDNMDTRAGLWDHYKTRCKLFVDGRMSALVFKSFAIAPSCPDQATYYAQTLHSQVEASPEPCGAKSIMFTVMMVAGQMCNQIKQYLMGERRAMGVIHDVYNDAISKAYAEPQQYNTIDFTTESVTI